MTSSEVLDIILDEIKDKSTLSNLHGLNLNKTLIKPIQQDYNNAMDTSQSFTLWTVLEENKDGTGYKIFYDEEENSFGLGMRDEIGELFYLAH